MWNLEYIDFKPVTSKDLEPIMKAPGFKITTCDCGQIVVKFAGERDDDSLEALNISNFDVAKQGQEIHCCSACGGDVHFNAWRSVIY